MTAERVRTGRAALTCAASRGHAYERKHGTRQRLSAGFGIVESVGPIVIGDPLKWTHRRRECLHDRSETRERPNEPASIDAARPERSQGRPFFRDRTNPIDLERRDAKAKFMECKPIRPRVLRRCRTNPSQTNSAMTWPSEPIEIGRPARLTNAVEGSMPS